MIKNYKNLSYANLLKQLLDITNQFSFIIRDSNLATKEMQNVIDSLCNYHLFDKDVKEWPGTVLYRGTAHIFVYSFIEESCKILIKNSCSLFDWLYPNRPEDLCFYYDGRPVFAAISHEQDCFFLENDT